MATLTTAADRRGLLDRILGRPGQAETPAPAARAATGNTPESRTAATSPAVDPVVPRPRKRHTWATLVERVRDVTRATAVLAIDDQGLVVAGTGDLPPGEIESIAAHVSLAFDLFERLSVLGKKTESVCAQYVPDGTWLTTIRMRPPVGPRITIGIVGPYTLVRDDRRKIRDAFEHLFDDAA